MTDRLFKAIPKSNVEAVASEPVVDESTMLVKMMMEIFSWFFNENGKHRDLLLQAPFADAFATNPSNPAQMKVTIQPIATYQYRQNPSITIQVGNPQAKKTGLGIALEHSKAANGLWCLQKRSLNKVNIKLMAETGSEQTTNKLAKLITEIFFQHIPQQYQNVVGNDLGQSQIIFPQEYNQPSNLVKELQQDANVERIWMYAIDFDVEFESIRFVRGANPIEVQNYKAEKYIDIDLPANLVVGQAYTINVKTNIPSVHLYSQDPSIFKLEQVSGPQGEFDGVKIYHGVALRVGPFLLQAEEGITKIKTQYPYIINYAPPVLVTVLPAAVTLVSGSTQQFSSTVQYAKTTKVIWSIQEVNGGVIDPTGLYTAPTVAHPTTFHVVATSYANSKQSCIIPVLVNPLP